MHLADVIETQAADLVAQWTERIPDHPAIDGVSQELEEDHIPALLQAFVQVLRGGSCAAAVALAREHADHRFRLGHSLDGLVNEYGVLRHVLLRQAMATGVSPTTSEMCTLADFITETTAAGVAQYSRQQEERARLAEASRNTLLASERGARSDAEAVAAELEAIFQSVPDALYVGNATGIVRANRPALAMLGYDDLEELNRDVSVLASEIQTRSADTGETMSAAEQPFSRALAGTAEVQDVVVRHRKTQRDYVVRSSCAPICVGGQVVGAVAVNVDITERTAAERSLKERVLFEQLLVGIVSHDLRSPLSAILLRANALMARDDVEAATLRAATRIRASAERAVRLIEELLDFTQARLGGGLPVRRQPLDFHELTRQAVEEVHASYYDRDVEVRAEGDAAGEWDPERITQLIGNLVSNAFKYSPRDSPVSVRSVGSGASVRLEVHNGGPPIKQEDRPRLFEPMQRGGATASSGRSVGLGLYIVSEIAKSHGGSVEVLSAEPDGTTFIVRLPKHGAPGPLPS